MKKSFTLLELFLALLLMSSIGIALGPHAVALFRDWEFEKDLSHIAHTLREAQLLALAYQTDLALTFAWDGSAYTITYTSHEPFPPALFDTRPHRLKSVKSLAQGSVLLNHQTLFIYADGSIDPPIVLALFRSRSENLTHPDVVLDCSGRFFVQAKKIFNKYNGKI